jgi:hypothetical protein
MTMPSGFDGVISGTAATGTFLGLREAVASIPESLQASCLGGTFRKINCDNVFE